METKFVVIGSGNLAVKTAEYLRLQGINPIVCEKKIVAVSIVEKLCKSKALPYHCFDSLEMTEYLLGILKESSLRVISAVNTYIFPKAVTLHDNFYGINYHNALLPYHKGMNTEAWAIYEMDKATGITWHTIRPEVDCGEILIQKSIEITSSTTSLKLLGSQSKLAYQAFEEIATDFIIGKNTVFTSQSDSNGRIHKIKDIPNDGFLDITWDINRISAFLRAMDYGKLYTLKHPKLIVNKTCYIWNSYKIKDGECAKEDSVVTNGTDIVIAKRGSNQKIYLKNVQKVRGTEYENIHL